MGCVLARCPSRCSYIKPHRALGQAQVEADQAARPWRMAAGMGYDDIIDPHELRNALLDGLRLMRDRLGRGPS